MIESNWLTCWIFRGKVRAVFLDSLAKFCCPCRWLLALLILFSSRPTLLLTCQRLCMFLLNNTIVIHFLTNSHFYFPKKFFNFDMLWCLYWKMTGLSLIILFLKSHLFFTLLCKWGFKFHDLWLTFLFLYFSIFKCTIWVPISETLKKWSGYAAYWLPLLLSVPMIIVLF